MITLNAGAFREYVVIQRVTVSKSATGVQTETWNDYGSRHASIRPLSATEVIAASAMQNRQTHVIEFRHMDGLSPRDRILHRRTGRIFHIVEVRDIEMRGRFDSIRVVERIE